MKPSPCFAWVVMVIVSLSVSACSHQQIYYSTQDLRLEDCETLSAREREACERRARVTYEEHESAYENHKEQSSD